ncbi:unnamed protein product, partial [Dovyalis caffra]
SLLLPDSRVPRLPLAPCSLRSKFKVQSFSFRLSQITIGASASRLHRFGASGLSVPANKTQKMLGSSDAEAASSTHPKPSPTIDTIVVGSSSNTQVSTKMKRKAMRP